MIDIARINFIVQFSFTTAIIEKGLLWYVLVAQRLYYIYSTPLLYKVLGKGKEAKKEEEEEEEKEETEEKEEGEEEKRCRWERRRKIPGDRPELLKSNKALLLN